MNNQLPEYKMPVKGGAIGFKIASLEFFFNKYTKSEISQPHRLHFYLILFITEGEGKHEIDFKTYFYKKGDFIFIRPGQVHTWKESSKPHGLMIFFTDDFFHKNQVHFKDISFTYPFNSLLYKPVLSLEKDKDYEVSHALTAYMYQEFNTKETSVRNEILQCLLRTLLLKMKALSEINKPIYNNEVQELFVRFYRLLEKKISTSRNVIDYCKWLGISYDKLNSICKELTNKTVKQYIDKVIILKSKSLLLDPKENINQIAYSIGFDEPTNFTKFFKKHTNFTPKEFQKNSNSI